MSNKTSFCSIFQQINRATNYKEFGKKEKLFCTGLLSVRMQNWAQQDKAQQENITFIQSTSFGRKNLNKASSLSNVGSVVGCSLKLFRRLDRDWFATLPKVNVKAEISELRPGINLFVMNVAIQKVEFHRPGERSPEQDCCC